MFGQNTITPLPPEYLSSYAAWDDYMARVWHSVFCASGALPSGYIVEIACGTSGKIGKALALSGFAGALYVVDPCRNALKTTCAHYRALLPKAQIHPIPLRLEQALSQLPPKPEWLLANHPLDDMLLAHGASDADIATLFDWGDVPSAQIQQSTAARWQQMQPQLAKAQAHLITIFQEALQVLQPGMLGLSQYASAALSEAPALAGLNDAAQESLQQLANALRLRAVNVQPALNQHPHYQRPYIGNEVLNAANWLVGAPR